MKLLFLDTSEYADLYQNKFYWLKHVRGKHTASDATDRTWSLDVEYKPFISSDACTSPSKGGGYKFSISNFYTGENPF